MPINDTEDATVRMELQENDEYKAKAKQESGQKEIQNENYCKKYLFSLFV